MSVGGLNSPAVNQAYGALHGIIQGGPLPAGLVSREAAITGVCQTLIAAMATHMTPDPSVASIHATPISESALEVKAMATKIHTLAQEIITKLNTAGHTLDLSTLPLDTRIAALHTQFDAEIRPMTFDDLKSQLKRTPGAMNQASDIAANKAVLVKFYERNGVPLDPLRVGEFGFTLDKMAEETATAMANLELGRGGEIKLAEGFYLTVVPSTPPPSPTSVARVVSPVPAVLEAPASAGQKDLWVALSLVKASLTPVAATPVAATPVAATPVAATPVVPPSSSSYEISGSSIGPSLPGQRAHTDAPPPQSGATPSESAANVVPQPVVVATPQQPATPTPLSRSAANVATPLGIEFSSALSLLSDIAAGTLLNHGGNIAQPSGVKPFLDSNVDLTRIGITSDSSSLTGSSSRVTIETKKTVDSKATNITDSTHYKANESYYPKREASRVARPLTGEERTADWKARVSAEKVAKKGNSVSSNPVRAASLERQQNLTSKEPTPPISPKQTETPGTGELKRGPVHVAVPNSTADKLKNSSAPTGLTKDEQGSIDSTNHQVRKTVDKAAGLLAKKGGNAESTERKELLQAQKEVVDAMNAVKNVCSPERSFNSTKLETARQALKETWDVLKGKIKAFENGNTSSKTAVPLTPVATAPPQYQSVSHSDSSVTPQADESKVEDLGQPQLAADKVTNGSQPVAAPTEGSQPAIPLLTETALLQGQSLNEDKSSLFDSSGQIGPQNAAQTSIVNTEDLAKKKGDISGSVDTSSTILRTAAPEDLTLEKNGSASSFQSKDGSTNVRANSSTAVAQPNTDSSHPLSAVPSNQKSNIGMVNSSPNSNIDNAKTFLVERQKERAKYNLEQGIPEVRNAQTSLNLLNNLKPADIPFQVSGGLKNAVGALQEGLQHLKSPINLEQAHVKIEEARAVIIDIQRHTSRFAQPFKNMVSTALTDADAAYEAQKTIEDLTNLSGKIEASISGVKTLVAAAKSTNDVDIIHSKLEEVKSLLELFQKMSKTSNSESVVNFSKEKIETLTGKIAQAQEVINAIVIGVGADLAEAEKNNKEATSILNIALKEIDKKDLPTYLQTAIEALKSGSVVDLENARSLLVEARSANYSDEAINEVSQLVNKAFQAKLDYLMTTPIERGAAAARAFNEKQSAIFEARKGSANPVPPTVITSTPKVESSSAVLGSPSNNSAVGSSDVPQASSSEKSSKMTLHKPSRNKQTVIRTPLPVAADVDKRGHSQDWLKGLKNAQGAIAVAEKNLKGVVSNEALAAFNEAKGVLERVMNGDPSIETLNDGIKSFKKTIENLRSLVDSSDKAQSAVVPDAGLVIKDENIPDDWEKHPLALGEVVSPSDSITVSQSVNPVFDHNIIAANVSERGDVTKKEGEEGLKPFTPIDMSTAQALALEGFNKDSSIVEHSSGLGASSTVNDVSDKSSSLLMDKGVDSGDDEDRVDSNFSQSVISSSSREGFVIDANSQLAAQVVTVASSSSALVTNAIEKIKETTQELENSYTAELSSKLTDLKRNITDEGNRHTRLEKTDVEDATKALNKAIEALIAPNVSIQALDRARADFKEAESKFLSIAEPGKISTVFVVKSKAKARIQKLFEDVNKALNEAKAFQGIKILAEETCEKIKKRSLSNVSETEEYKSSISANIESLQDLGMAHKFSEEGVQKIIVSIIKAEAISSLTSLEKVYAQALANLEASGSNNTKEIASSVEELKKVILINAKESSPENIAEAKQLLTASEERLKGLLEHKLGSEGENTPLRKICENLLLAIEEVKK